MDESSVYLSPYCKTLHSVHQTNRLLLITLHRKKREEVSGVNAFQSVAGEFFFPLVKLLKRGKLYTENTTRSLLAYEGDPRVANPWEGRASLQLHRFLPSPPSPHSTSLNLLPERSRWSGEQRGVRSSDVVDFYSRDERRGTR